LNKKIGHCIFRKKSYLEKTEREAMKELVPVERIENKILLIRGQKVILSNDLAELYNVLPKRLIEQVKRNIDKFPDDFMFQLTRQEVMSLKSQFATSKKGRGGVRKLPYAFTEHGAIMAANVLNSRKACEMSILVVRTFVKIRKTAFEIKEISDRIKELENKVGKTDTEVKYLFEVIRQLMTPPPVPPKGKIGFHS
jgi:phage regulator Rha-like protein